MKTIGMIGGMSWESTLEYYRILNESVVKRLGGLHSAKTVICTMDFSDVDIMVNEGRWQDVTQLMVKMAQQVQAGGADLLILCANTAHKIADQVQENIDIPLLHIADVTAEAIKMHGLRKVGLLGTKTTMEEKFYRGRLVDKHSLVVLIPETEERSMIHRVIFEELVLGIINPASKAELIHIIDRLIQAGAQGIILGCTEFGLVLKDGDSRVPLFDTARIHAEAAVELALINDPC